MKIKSFTLNDNTICEVTIEVSLIPGLPSIHLLGLPSPALKESVLRIKSAIKCSGYKTPLGKQIIINLTPTNVKKESLGLELAITAAILYKISNLIPPSELYFYGEVNLDGKIVTSDDLNLHSNWIKEKNLLVVTGKSQKLTNPNFSGLEVSKLEEILNLKSLNVSNLANKTSSPTRPTDWDHLKVSKNEALLLKILAWGGHSCLIAGPAGTGKTTLSKIAWSFLEFHNHELTKSYLWPHYSKPHHSTPLASLLGGGTKIFKGEATQSHLGVFVLDELLEFSKDTLEAFRQPLEEQKIEVIRQGKKVSYNFDAQIIATTNLCPCGDWTPDRSKEILCNFNFRKCRSYCEKLSGPMLDRFDFVFYSDDQKKEILVKDIYNELKEIKKTHQENGYSSTKNSNLKISFFQNNEKWANLEELLPKIKTSLRRTTAILKISKTLSELDQRSNIEAKDIEQAVSLALTSSEKLKTMQPYS